MDLKQFINLPIAKQRELLFEYHYVHSKTEDVTMKEIERDIWLLQWVNNMELIKK